jgi:ketosteroid isomerase-like protein
MKSLAIVFAALLASPALAADPAVEAPIRTFLDSFNKGDVAAAAATHVSGGVTIVDEVAPYRWSSFQDWLGALDKESKDGGLTDQSVTATGPIVRELVSGDSAYVILPVRYAFKARGKPMREDAQMTFVLSREAGGWKIAGWTWTGPDPRPSR